MAKVLIIEDEKAMSDLISIKFKVEGFEVDQAFSIAEAKQKLAQPGVNAILSDYLLPDGNSVDFLAEVRANQATAQIPIVIMTNYVEDVNLEKAKSLGVAEVIVKYQVVPAQMVEKIKALISSGPMPASAPAAAPVAEQPVSPPTQPLPDPTASTPQTEGGTTPAVPTPPPVSPSVPPAMPVSQDPGQTTPQPVPDPTVTTPEQNVSNIQSTDQSEEGAK